jgi:hypothetical protein
MYFSYCARQLMIWRKPLLAVLCFQSVRGILLIKNFCKESSSGWFLQNFFPLVTFYCGMFAFVRQNRFKNAELLQMMWAITKMYWKQSNSYTNIECTPMQRAIQKVFPCPHTLWKFNMCPFSGGQQVDLPSAESSHWRCLLNIVISLFIHGSTVSCWKYNSVRLQPHMALTASATCHSG